VSSLTPLWSISRRRLVPLGPRRFGRMPTLQFGGRHCSTVTGERFVGLVAEDIAQVIYRGAELGKRRHCIGTETDCETDDGGRRFIASDPIEEDCEHWLNKNPPRASIAVRNTSSCAERADRIASASASHRRVEPSISVNKNVTTPEGSPPADTRTGCHILASHTAPTTLSLCTRAKWEVPIHAQLASR
jgi:hypothetical protein